MTGEANVAGRPMSPGGQCHFGPGRSMSPLAGEANVREVNVGEANVIAPPNSYHTAIDRCYVIC